MQTLETPCFILDKSELIKNITEFKEALNTYFKHNIIAYSFKTNSQENLLHFIKDQGCYAEVVSHDEYEVAKLIGFPVNRIVYNGLIKSKETVFELLNNNGLLNIDTKRELDWVVEYAKIHHNKEVKVGIRINSHIENEFPCELNYVDTGSRFGFKVDNDEFKDALNKLSNQNNIKVCGLHFHRTSKTRSDKIYMLQAKIIGETAKKYNLELEYVDLGGGYFGGLKDKITYLEYAEALFGVLNAYFDLNKVALIVEPGNAVVASVFKFLTTVIDVKKGINEHFIVIDGSRNDIDPFFAKSSYFTEVFSSSQFEETPQIITGCTCLEYDRLFEYSGKLLNVGDQILFDKVGAYTMALSPLFIRFFPKVYVCENGKYTLVKEKWNACKHIGGEIK